MVKELGGRKKTVDTESQACDNPDCRHVNVRNANIHALAGNGARGETDDIQRLICLACGRRFSARRDTGLKDLKRPRSGLNWR